MAWPEDDEPAYFGAIADAIRASFEAALEISPRGNDEVDIPWNAPNIGDSLKASCLQPREALSAECRKRTLESQGRDTLDTLIQLTLQIGMEQGRRSAIQDYGRFTDLKEKLLRAIEEAL